MVGKYVAIHILLYFECLIQNLTHLYVGALSLSEIVKHFVSNLFCCILLIFQCYVFVKDSLTHAFKWQIQLNW